MRAELYWIDPGPDHRLAIMPRPRAGDWLEDELASWRREGLDVVVSLLGPGEVLELGLAGEEAGCKQAGLQFVSFPITDCGVPSSTTSFTTLIAELADLLKQGKRVGIHCRIGVGRAALVAACLLARQGMSPDEALALISRCRGQSVPDTAEQVRWIEAWVRHARDVGSDVLAGAGSR